MKDIEKQAIKEVINKAKEKLLTAKVDFNNNNHRLLRRYTPRNDLKFQ